VLPSVLLSIEIRALGQQLKDWSKVVFKKFFNLSRELDQFWNNFRASETSLTIYVGDMPFWNNHGASVSNVIDASESQSEKQPSPMTETEAGR
jgi:hypothetical protein